MKTCLLVIDAQESFRHRPYFTNQGLQAYITAQNELLQGCLKAGVPVVRIFHVDGPVSPSNPFALESGHVRPLSELAPFEPAATFHKNRHSALVGTGLEVWLTRHGVGRIIISGIRTEQCCETTARHASDVGYEVDYVLDATLTFDMQLADGSPLPAADIRARTAAVLEGRFAKICTAEQALERCRGNA